MVGSGMKKAEDTNTGNKNQVEMFEGKTFVCAYVARIFTDNIHTHTHQQG